MLDTLIKVLTDAWVLGSLVGMVVLWITLFELLRRLRGQRGLSWEEELDQALEEPPGTEVEEEHREPEATEPLPEEVPSTSSRPLSPAAAYLREVEERLERIEEKLDQILLDSKSKASPPSESSPFL